MCLYVYACEFVLLSGNIYEDRHVDSPVKQTAEELLAALGLSTNPLATLRKDVGNHYLNHKLEPPSSWKKNVEGPYGILDYMKQRELEKNLLNPPLKEPPITGDEKPIYNYDKFRSSSELEDVRLDGKKSAFEDRKFFIYQLSYHKQDSKTKIICFNIIF